MLVSLLEQVLWLVLTESDLCNGCALVLIVHVLPVVLVALQATVLAQSHIDMLVLQATVWNDHTLIYYMSQEWLMWLLVKPAAFCQDACRYLRCFLMSCQ